MDEYHDSAPEFPLEEKIPNEEVVAEQKISLETINSYTSSSVAATETILATAAVAVIATAAIIIPLIENANIQIDMDVSFIDGVLSYSIEIYEPDENETYQVFVLENGVVIHQQIIENYQISESIEGLVPYNDYRLEVRAGTPPLLVLSSYDIPASSIWAEWDNLLADYNYIEYSVLLYGDSTDALIGLYDPDTDDVVYTMSLIEGLNTGYIDGLESAHTYIAYVSSGETLLLAEEIDTLIPDVYWEYLTVSERSIEYGINVNDMFDNLTLTCTDIGTSAVIYTKDLEIGMNADVISDLSYGHSYQIVVASPEFVYLSEELAIELEPTVVTLGYLTLSETTIEYEVIVTGDRDTATATLTDSTAGSTVYTSVLSVGTNTGTIDSLQYGHTYQFKVASTKQTYITETLVLPAEPTEVTLGSLTVSGNAIDYEITVNGSRDAVTLNLYDSDDGSTVFTQDLSQGLNAGTIDSLQYSHDYQFTVSSATVTYIDEVLTTGADPTSVDLLNLVVESNTIWYRVSVTGGSDRDITLHLYDPELEEDVYSRVVFGAETTDTIVDLNFDYTYQLIISADDGEVFVEEDVYIPIGELSIGITSTPRGNTLLVDVSIQNMTENATLYLYDEFSEMVADPIELNEASTQNEFTDLYFDTDYRITVVCGDAVVDKQTKTDPMYELGSLTIEGEAVRYNVKANISEEYGAELRVYFAGYDFELEEEVYEYIDSIEITERFEEFTGLIDSSFNEDIGWSSSIRVTIYSDVDEEEVVVGDITIFRATFDYFEVNGYDIKYTITVHDEAGAADATLDVYDREEDEKYIELNYGLNEGTVEGLIWGHSYGADIRISGGMVSYDGDDLVIPYPVTLNQPLSYADGRIYYDVTVDFEELGDITAALVFDVPPGASDIDFVLLEREMAVDGRIQGSVAADADEGTYTVMAEANDTSQVLGEVEVP